MFAYRFCLRGVAPATTFERVQVGVDVSVSVTAKMDVDRWKSDEECADDVAEVCCDEGFANVFCCGQLRDVVSTPFEIGLG